MGWIYILASASGRALYVGSTSDLPRRIAEHKRGAIPGFTRRYNVHRLVYFERATSIEAAQVRECQIKGYRRAKKDILIDSRNPTRVDLADLPGFIAAPA